MVSAYQPIIRLAASPYGFCCTTQSILTARYGRLVGFCTDAYRSLSDTKSSTQERRTRGRPARFDSACWPTIKFDYAATAAPCLPAEIGSGQSPQKIQAIDHFRTSEPR